MSIGTDTEVGRLRTVLVHRPGAELNRVTPRTRDRLRFDGLPWLARAQREHDEFTAVLRDRGVEVLYITELLQDVLEYQAAAEDAIGSVLADAELGDELGRGIRGYLESLAPQDLASALIGGLTPEELRTGRGLVYELLDPHDFIIEPLPSLVFSRDSSVWIGDRPVVTSLAGPRRREADLLAVIYDHHPRFRDARAPYRAGRRYLDGGDVLLLAPGVLAIGVGVRTNPASVEQLARQMLQTGEADAVLAVPMNQRGERGHLDTTCTVVDAGTVVMAPYHAFTLTALTITAPHGEPRVSRPRPFIEAAALALGIDRLKVIDTGLDLPGGERGQWDDGGNALALGHRVTICDERNVETNERLADAGFEVLTVPWRELGGGRGGPRCLCAPLNRDSAAARAGEAPAVDGWTGELARPLAAGAAGSTGSAGSARVPGPSDPVSGRQRRAGELEPA
jgi:arginine deiminase